MTTRTTLPALSIRQPWAWFITRPDLVGDARAAALAAGHIKTIENRSWPTNFRGRFLIHAGKGMTIDEFDAALEFARVQVRLDVDLLERLAVGMQQIPRGGIVGVADLTGCTPVSSSPWFVGDFGLELANIKPLPFLEYRGALSFFRVEVSQEYLDTPHTTPIEP